jgi:nucleotide-binding universal stress UspA family protein
MYRKLLVPIDSAERSLAAVREAAALGKSLGAQLLLLHVRSPIDAPRHVEGGALSRLPAEVVMQEVETEERKVLESAVQLAAESGIQAEMAFVYGYSVHETILHVAETEGCDLIVMASHGRSGLAGLLLGSETQKLLTQARTPVLIVR